MTHFMSTTDLNYPSSAEDEIPAKIVFLGSKINFPDSLLRMVMSEIHCATISRALSPSDLPMPSPGALEASLVILDETVAEALGAAEISQLERRHILQTVVAYRDPQRAIALLQNHADTHNTTSLSLIPMDLNMESWLSILRLLLTGCSYVPPELFMQSKQTALPEHDAQDAHDLPHPEGALGKLTAREVQVLALVAEGLQNKHIADKLCLSEHTVKLHLHHVISKLGARNRTDAALRYKAGMDP